MSTRLATAALIGSVGGATALAGPLNKAWVAADAKWVVHVDVEAAVGSTFGKCVVEHQKDLDLEPLTRFNTLTGLDALKDIKGVTLYSPSLAADGGVVVVVGTANMEASVKRLAEKDKTVHKLESDGGMLYRWSENGVEKFGCLRNTGQSDRMLIVCGTRAELDSAIGVVDGKAETAAKIEEGPFAARPGEGSMVFVAVRGIEAGASGNKGPKVLGTAREVNADIGENGEGMYGNMKLKAATAADAKNTAQFLQGILAVGKMAAGEDPETKQLTTMMESVTFEAKEEELTARFRVKREQLRALVDEVKAERMKSAQNEARIEKTRQEKQKP